MQRKSPKRIRTKKDPKDAYLKRKYGIGIKEYNVMLERQERKCAICGTKPKKGLVLDHMHNSNPMKIRDLLCGQCNSGLGMFREDVSTMETAIAYLKRHMEDYGRMVMSEAEKLDELLDLF